MESLCIGAFFDTALLNFRYCILSKSCWFYSKFIFVYWRIAIWTMFNYSLLAKDIFNNIAVYGSGDHTSAFIRYSSYTNITESSKWGWSGGAKVLCILHHWGVQLILAYSWARPAILVVGKGRGGMFLFLLSLHFHSCSSFFPVPLFHLLYSLFYLFSPFL